MGTLEAEGLEIAPGHLVFLTGIVQKGREKHSDRIDIQGLHQETHIGLRVAETLHKLNEGPVHVSLS